jgi:LmbE family N-acetylglucosaminyl deacetylase
MGSLEEGKSREQVRNGMLAIRFAQKEKGPLKILCLGAHSDDIEIGCGGTILQMLESNRDLVFHWVVFSANERRKKEALASAAAILKHAKEKKVVIKTFRDGHFPYMGSEIKEYVETIKKAFSPDLIFTPCRHDLHQDHRLISELTWNTFRDHWILEYEIPKYDGDLQAPNVFVHLDEKTCSAKVSHIVKYFKSQADNHWFGEETLLSIMRLRGIESNAPNKYAEAFYGRKVIFSQSPSA